MFAIRRATTPEDFAIGRALFREYAAALNVDLCFQSFEQELESLSTMYAHPDGALLLAIASSDGAAVACVAVRRLDRETCEMKRLYVRPAVRAHGLGRRLVDTLIADARRLGYKRMRLDTLPSMTEARALYASTGFHEIPAYTQNPVPGVAYLELTL
jgi:GNAT superfamily N-acetyltransferase